MEAERPGWGEACAPLHDPCAVAAAIDPGLFRFEERALGVRVDEGPERGRLLPQDDPEAPRARYAVEVDAPALLRTFVDSLSRWASTG